MREASELDEGLEIIQHNLPCLMEMMHKEVLSYVGREGKKEPNEALSFWKKINARTDDFFSPRPYKMVARACLASQASSAPAERLFSDLGKSQNNQAQALLSETL